MRKHPEEFYHAQLQLYLPWRDERKDLLGNNTSFEVVYNCELQTVIKNRSKFEHHAEEVAQAIQDLEEFGIPEQSWQVVAPQTEQFRADEAEEGYEHQEGGLSAFEGQCRVSSMHAGLTHFQYEINHAMLNTADWQDLILTLNKAQTEVHQFIVEWCTGMILSRHVPRPPPFHIYFDWWGWCRQKPSRKDYSADCYTVVCTRQPS